MSCRSSSSLGWFALATALAVMPLAGCSARPDSTPNAVHGVMNICARVAAPVAAVFVTDQQAVKQGALLVELDSEPLRTELQHQQSRLDVAKAELEQAQAGARTQAAAAAAAWSRIGAARNTIRENVARLHSAVAMLKLRQSEQALAQRQYERAVQQAKQRQITPDEMDERRASLEVAQQQVVAAEATVNEARSRLGLDARDEDPAAVPQNMERRSIGLQTAAYEFAQALAELGSPLDLDVTRLMGDENPLAKAGDHPSLAESLQLLATQTPNVRLAAAQVSACEQQVRQAESALAQTKIHAPAAGIVTLRAVNPGKLVEPGQTLLTIRSDNSSASKPAVESVGNAAAAR